MAIPALLDYIDDPGRRQRLARTVPIHPQYLWQVAHGWRHKRASRLMACAIERATSGAVTRHDLRPDIWPEPSKEASHAA